MQLHVHFQSSFVQKPLIADVTNVRIVLVTFHVMSKITPRDIFLTKSTKHIFRIEFVDILAFVLLILLRRLKRDSTKSAMLLMWRPGFFARARLVRLQAAVLSKLFRGKNFEATLGTDGERNVEVHVDVIFELAFGWLTSTANVALIAGIFSISVKIVETIDVLRQATLFSLGVDVSFDAALLFDVLFNL